MKLSFPTSSFRMSILQGVLLVLLMASQSLCEQEPNCTGVEDFKCCPNTTDNFCPVNVSCQCKDGKPFCRCNYFRLDWKEYWYMGPKCNHLWNTGDFILVSTLPGIGLVLIVVIIFSTVICLKSKKAGKQRASPYSEAHHNPAFTAAGDGYLEHGHQPRDNSNWIGQIPKVVVRRQDFDAPGPSESYRNLYSQQSRRPDSTPDYASIQRPRYEQFAYHRDDLPYGGYAEGRQYQKY